MVDGRFLFTLYDTYGFPPDLAKDVFQDAGWQITAETDRVFESEMEAQRERARAGASFGAADSGEPSVAIYQRLSTELAKPQFLGYGSLAAPARILALVADGQRRRDARQGETVEIILDRTPAYAESGGQQGDTGSITGREGQGQIQDTYYRGSQLIVHRVAVTQGQLREGEEVAVSVESRRRQGLRQHHTGTHLLHAALRKVLGTHVAQAGSLVAPDHLRFDFSHGASVKDSEVEEVEGLVNEQVQANIVVSPAEMDLQEALRTGAMALFGEKYGDRVRVIRIGDFSTELCGGTHLDATGQIGLFKVTDEGAVASGVRRIEAVTGRHALAHVGREEAALPASRRASSRSRPSSCPVGSPRCWRTRAAREAARPARDQARAHPGAGSGGRREAGGGRAGARRAARRARRGRPARGGRHAPGPAAVGDHPARQRGGRQGEPGRGRLQGPDEALPGRPPRAGDRQDGGRRGAAVRTWLKPAARTPPSSTKPSAR